MTSKELITELYIGYFDRAPDPAGLAFWVAVLDGGLSLEAIAIDFSTQPEAQDTYAFLDALIPPGPASGGEDIEAFITAIYDNLFDREPDPAGLAFWKGVLEGGFPPGSFILAIIEGASPADEEILANKVEVACAWSDLAAEVDGFVLTEAYITGSRDALGEVSGDPDSVTEGKAAADLFFQEGPSIALTGQITTLPEDTDLTARLKVANIVVSDDGIGTNELTLSGADADLFEIDGDELFLKAGTALDFETVTQYSVTVEVDDAAFGGSPDDAATLTLSITDVNDAPTVALSGTITALDEDEDTSAAIKVANIVISDDALGTNTLSLSGDDAGLFEIVGDELFLKAGTALDFDSNPSLDVTVEVEDTEVGGSPDDGAVLSIAVGDVNEAPSVALIDQVAILSEDLDTTTRVKVAGIVVSDDLPGTNVLSLSGDDADLFEIDGDELFLKAGTVLDFETNASLDVTVEVDDAGVGASPDDTAALSITVTDVNEAPSVALAGQVTVLAEEADTSAAIKVADIVLSDDGTGSNTLSLTGADAGLFEIQGMELYLKAGSALDFETNPVLDVTVTVNDAAIGGDPDDSAALSITLTDVNEAPSVALANATSVLVETEDTSARVKVADIVLSDDGLGTNALSLTGTDAALFEIDGTELFLKAGTDLDFEANPMLDVTVEVDDAAIGADPDDSASLSITVTDDNEPPTLAVINVPASLPEDTDITTRVKVGDIVITDDIAGTNTLSLTGDDAALFEIDGTELFLTAGTVLDFETDAALDVTVVVDDTQLGTGPEDSVALTIGVTDANEAPSVVLTSPVTALSEDTDTTARIKMADIVVTDDAIGTNTLSLTGADAGLFEIDGTELYLKAGTALDFETNPALDVSVDVDDAGIGAGAEDSAALSVSVTNVNEPPSVTLLGADTAIFEGANTSFPIEVATIQVDDDGTGTNDLALTGADAALFEIVGTSLRIKAGTALDAVANPMLDVTVTVDDAALGGSPDDSAALTITVNPGAAGLAADNTEILTFTGGAGSTLRAGQIEVPDADPVTPGDQPGFVINTDPNGTPYAGVASNALSLIDVTGHAGLVSLGVIAEVDSEDFTLDNSGSAGDVEACLGEGNDLGVLTTPTLSATGTWVFDNTGATGTMEIEIKAIDVAPGGTLDFNNVDICISGDVDLTGAVFDVDAASTIEIKDGGKLTLTVEQVDDLQEAGVVIFGAGTVCVTGESDGTGAGAGDSDTDFANLQTATVDLSAVTLAAGDGDDVLNITASGAMSDDAGTALVADGARIAQTIIGSANNDAVTVAASAGDSDGTTRDLILMLGEDSGSIGVPGETPSTNTPDDLTPEEVGDEIFANTGLVNLQVIVDAGFDQVNVLTSDPSGGVDPNYLADSVQVASGAEFYAAGVSDGWIADGTSSNDGIAVIESDGSVSEIIDVSAAGGANGWTLIGASDAAFGSATTLTGSNQDDVLIDGAADDDDNDGEEDSFTGNAGEDTFVFNIASSVAAELTETVVQVGADLEAYTITGTAPGGTVSFEFQIGGTSPASVTLTDGVGGADLTTTAGVAAALAAALNTRPDAFATAAGSVVTAGGENAARLTLLGGSGAVLVGATDILDDFGGYANDPADADDDRSESLLTITGMVAEGEFYTVTIKRGDGSSYEGGYTVGLGDTLQVVLDGLATSLAANSGGTQTFHTSTNGALLPLDAPQSGAPAAGELLILDADMEFGPAPIGVDPEGGFTITFAGGTSTVVALSSSSQLDGSETTLDQADADFITDFIDSEDSIDFDTLDAGDNSNYDDGGEVADFATALGDANGAMDGTVIYYFTSTAADGGLLFYDANGDGTADGVVSLPGVDASSFDDSNIV